ncbi:MAG: hypothetical protein NZM07_09785 [Elioraea sp.]|nr:hypothetical protein [Elioraea sp.]
MNEIKTQTQNPKTNDAGISDEEYRRRKGGYLRMMELMRTGHVDDDTVYELDDPPRKDWQDRASARMIRNVISRICEDRATGKIVESRDSGIPNAIPSAALSEMASVLRRSPDPMVRGMGDYIATGAVSVDGAPSALSPELLRLIIVGTAGRPFRDLPPMDRAAVAFVFPDAKDGDLRLYAVSDRRVYALGPHDMATIERYASVYPELAQSTRERIRAEELRRSVATHLQVPYSCV